MTLTRHLAVDTLRRMLTIYAVAAAMILMLDVLANTLLSDGTSLPSRSEVLAWSLAASWFLAFSPAMLLEAREITSLPVSRRQLWIARWWLAVVAPSTILGSVIAVAPLIGTPAVGLDQLVVILIFCSAYGGCYMALTALFPLPGLVKPGTWGVIHLLLKIMVIPLGGAAAPLWFAKYLPQQISELSGTAMSSVVAAVGVTIASYFYRPAITTRSNRRAVPSKPVPASRSTRDSRLSGLTLLLWKEGRKGLVAYGVAFLVSIIYWRFIESGLLVDFFHAGSVLIFAGLPPPPDAGVPLVVMFFAMGTSDLGLSGELRSLRALPVSTNRLSAIVTSLSVVTTAMLWFVLLIAHAAAVGTAPQSLRPELFLYVSGAFAISNAARLALPGDQMVKIFAIGFVLLPGFFWLPASAHFDSVVKTGIAAGGSLALIVSWLITARTMRLSHRVYKRQSPLALISS